MARNLSRTTCYYCDHEIELLEQPHFITEKYAGNYYKELEKLIVAHAQCPICLAQYLTWINCSGNDFVIYANTSAEFGKIMDLSFYHSFDDEPSEKDLPVYDVQKITTWHRVAKLR